MRNYDVKRNMRNLFSLEIGASQFHLGFTPLICMV